VVPEKVLLVTIDGLTGARVMVREIVSKKQSPTTHSSVKTLVPALPVTPWREKLREVAVGEKTMSRVSAEVVLVFEVASRNTSGLLLVARIVTPECAIFSVNP
jgi:hypothetical protein